jgi:hypothetical protein
MDSPATDFPTSQITRSEAERFTNGVVAGYIHALGTHRASADSGSRDGGRRVACETIAAGIARAGKWRRGGHASPSKWTTRLEPTTFG